MIDKSKFMARIASKLAILVGGVIAATGTQVPAIASTMTQGNSISGESASRATLKSMPAKLILKQQKQGFRMLASHESHSSHSSHHSHSSHSSHTSSAI